MLAPSSGITRLKMIPLEKLLLSKMLASYSRDIGSKKRRGIMPQREGKDHISRDGYERLGAPRDDLGTHVVTCFRLCLVMYIYKIIIYLYLYAILSLMLRWIPF